MSLFGLGKKKEEVKIEPACACNGEVATYEASSCCCGGQQVDNLSNPLHIVLIAVPLTVQTVLIFFIAYSASKIFGMSHDIAAPAGMIGASNFFELAVAVAIALFGTTSPAALATTVGVLTEVPVMLALVKVANSTRGWFKK